MPSLRERCPHARANIAVLSGWLKSGLERQSWGCWKTQQLSSLPPIPCFYLDCTQASIWELGYHRITTVDVGSRRVPSPSWSSCMHLSYLSQFLSPSLKPFPSSCEHIDLQSCTDSSQALWCFCLQASLSHYFCIGHLVLTADTNHTFYKSISKAFSLEWVFHLQENSTDIFFCTWNIGLLSW